MILSALFVFLALASSALATASDHNGCSKGYELIAYEPVGGPKELVTKPEDPHHDKHTHKHRCRCLNMDGRYMDIASHCTYTLTNAESSPVCKPDCKPHHPHRPHHHEDHDHDHDREHHHKEHDHDHRQKGHPHHHKGYKGHADMSTDVEMWVSSALDKVANRHHHHHHDKGSGSGNDVISPSTMDANTIPPVADIKNNEKRSTTPVPELHQYQPRRPHHHHYPHAPRSFCPTGAIECPSSSSSSAASECIWPNEDLYNCGGCSYPSDASSAKGEDCETMEGVIEWGSYCYEGRCYARECDEAMGYILGADGGRCEKGGLRR